MNYTQSLTALANLGDSLKAAINDESLIHRAFTYNNWFTPEFQKQAFLSWSNLLKIENLQNWLAPYQLEIQENASKTVAIIMAGNIPLVGLHDLISVLVCGHRALIKPSSDDKVLMEWVVKELKNIDSEFENFIELSEERQMKNFDVIIATGSNNSFRYFEYYFKDKPSLLRKNRNSIAVLRGNESKETLELLADDVFQYFGLGCRNVSKLLIPKDFFVDPMFEAFEKYKEHINHHKYANNYTYHKAIFLMNLTAHLDNNFLLFKQDEKIASPLGVLLFDYYENEEQVKSYLNQHEEEIQCVVSDMNLIGAIPFGQSQNPQLNDYADGIDTISFLKGI
jgi:hypothetical protein